MLRKIPMPRTIGRSFQMKENSGNLLTLWRQRSPEKQSPLHFTATDMVASLLISFIFVFFEILYAEYFYICNERICDEIL